MNDIQTLLDEEAQLSNNGCSECQECIDIHNQLKILRGNEPPVCWGEDDCSSLMLMSCPWRIDCGQEENLRWKDD